MRRAVIVFLATFALAVPVFGQQPGYIGLYADPGGSGCNVMDVPGLINVYVIHQGTEPVIASEFKVAPLSGFDLVWVDDIVHPPLYVGNTQDGISIAYGACVALPLLAVTIQYLAYGSSGACGLLEVVPDPVVSWNQILEFDCSAVVTERVAGGSRFYVNPDGSCSCGPLPVVEQIHEIATNPDGLEIQLDYAAHTAPLEFLSTVGDPYTISTTAIQPGPGDSVLVFTQWSDLGELEHQITAPVMRTRYTAYFEAKMLMPSITSVEDVPDDQGGWVRIGFARSAYDDVIETESPVTTYNIHRRVDDPALASTVMKEGEELAVGSVVQFPGGEAVPWTSPADGGKLYRYGGGYFFRAGQGSIEMPPGLWEVVGSVAARQQEEYLVLAPTLADSTETLYYTKYFIAAHTTNPFLYFDGPVDSGYSVDNLPPGVPLGFAVAYNQPGGNVLDWDASTDRDFQFYRVYRDVNPGFVPGPGNLIHELAETGWQDPSGDHTHEYKLSAVDYVGNESDATGPDTRTSVGSPATPERFALHQNVPNPFNPTTTIHYEIPAGGATVEIVVYDTAGRLVRTLVGGHHTAGVKSVTWDGTTDSGETVATGVYFYRMTAGNFVQTRKMLLIK
jgi:hypothetical protein